MFLAGTQKIAAVAGPRRLLEDVTVSVQDGDRIGILGPNGAGKSTLLRILTAEREPDAGSVTVTGGVHFSSLAQRPDYRAGESVGEYVLAGRPLYAWESDPVCRDIGNGLLKGIDWKRPLAELSGGQVRRVALAKTLAAPSEVLALDEPTNHLDIEGVAWLAAHLNARFRNGKGALLVITHDRWFLDAVCTQIWEVVPGVELARDRGQLPGRVEIYEGSYAAYILARAERARLDALAEEKRQNLLRKELAWLRRGAPARTSKPRFRIEAAESLIEAVPAPRDDVELVKLATARLGKRVLELEGVSFHYPQTQRELLKDVTWRLAPGERVGVIGVNGAGKSTLLGLLEGRLEPTSGYILRGKTVQCAALEQEATLSQFAPEKRVVEAVSSIKERICLGKGEISAAQLVERLGFIKTRAWTRLDALSGGERRRLQLACQLLAEPNVLLLDEPTNDLDTDTLAQLEDLLDAFAGTLVVVSHDRYLLERVTDHQVALLADGTLLDLPGGVEQYLALCAGEEPVGANAASPVAPEVASLNSTLASAKPNATEGAESREKSALSGAQLHATRKKLAALERKLAKLTSRLEELDEELARAAGRLEAADYLEKLQALQSERDAQAAQRESLEEEWMDLASQLEE